MSDGDRMLPALGADAAGQHAEPEAEDHDSSDQGQATGEERQDDHGAPGESDEKGAAMGAHFLR